MFETIAHMLAGVVIALLIIIMVVRCDNTRYIKKRTGLSRKQRELNRAVARKQWETLYGARLQSVDLSEDPFYSYTKLNFTNNYTVTIAAAHGHLATSVEATEELTLPERPFAATATR